MDALRNLPDTWASIYSGSASLRSLLSFVHIGGLVLAGGIALAADIGGLKAIARGKDALQRELQRLHDSHRLVIAGLVAVVVSGVLLMFADLDAYLESTVFWIKMMLVAALLANGALLVRTGVRARSADAGDVRRLRLVSLLSLALWACTTLAGSVLPNAL